MCKVLFQVEKIHFLETCERETLHEAPALVCVNKQLFPLDILCQCCLECVSITAYI